MKQATIRTHLIAALFAAVLIVPAAWAVQPETKDVTPLFTNGGIVLEGLRAVDVGGILVLRGRTIDPAQAEAASAYARSLGYTRVANLVQITAPVDDAAIERTVERQLALQRSLDGCNIKIASQGGAVRISGTVQHELQKDFALQVVRNVDGVKSVRSDLQRF
jgi:osmotically-inducible protein OsmY